jgi:hypothetical protein
VLRTFTFWTFCSQSLPCATNKLCPAGSHLLIQPVNSPHLVESAPQLLRLSGQEAVEWTPAVTQEAAARGCCVPPMTISSRQALAYLADLAAVPTRRQVTGCYVTFVQLVF